MTALRGERNPLRCPRGISIWCDSLLRHPETRRIRLSTVRREIGMRANLEINVDRPCHALFLAHGVGVFRPRATETRAVMSCMAGRPELCAFKPLA